MGWLDIVLVIPLALLLLLIRIRLRMRRLYTGRRLRIRALVTVAVLGLLPTLRIIVVTMRDPAHLPGVAVGAVSGMALGLAGLANATFKRDEAGLWYKRDPYTGSILLALIIGWMSYRFYARIVLHNGFFVAPLSPPWGLFAPAAILSFWYTNFAGILRYALTKDLLRSWKHRPESGGARAPGPARVGGGGGVEQSRKASVQPTDRTSSLVPLKPEGSKPPLFLVPGAGVTVSTFGPLLKHLGPEQPVYGLQHLGMDGKDRPHDRVEDMAAHFKNEILHVQPHGPYLLGGRCFGGLVALEIALQLHDEGHEVALVALIDVIFPPATRRLGSRLLEPMMPLFDANNPPDRTLPRALRYCTATLGRWALTGLYSLRQTVNRHDPENRRFADLPETQTHVIIETLLAHRRARVRYTGRVYPGALTLFAAEADHRIKRKFQELWENCATGGLRRHVVPGNHRTLCSEPNVRILAAKLTESINEALTGRRARV